MCQLDPMTGEKTRGTLLGMIDPLPFAAIDVHTHIVPDAFPPCLGGFQDVAWPSMRSADACHKHVVISGKTYRTVPDSCWDTLKRIEHMNASRVLRQALSPMPELLSYWLPLELGRTLCRYLNDYIASMVASSPSRFVGLGSVPLQDVDAGIRELEYVMLDLRLAGVEVASHVNGVSIGDTRFEPFFAACARFGAAVFVHPLRPAGDTRVVGPFTEQAVCFPGDIALAAASLITGGVAARHPDLRVAFSHGGGALAVLLPRLVHAWKASVDLQVALSESPATTARRFYYDELVFDVSVARLLLESFGPSQVMLGSDYPFALGEPDPVRFVEQVGLNASTLNAVCAANAERFLGLNLRHAD